MFTMIKYIKLIQSTKIADEKLLTTKMIWIPIFFHKQTRYSDKCFILCPNLPQWLFIWILHTLTK